MTPKINSLTIFFFPALLGLLLLFSLCMFTKIIAQDYSYQSTIHDEDIEDEETLERARTIDTDQVVLERKKKKKGKKKPSSNNTFSLPQPPLCEPPMCLIQDPILPDETCNNDCPQGSGWHCQGRHNLLTHDLFAICVPD